MPFPKERLATQKQIDYIIGLGADCSLDYTKLKFVIGGQIDRDIKTFAELTLSEASRVIEYLKERKDTENQWDDNEDDKFHPGNWEDTH